MNHVMKDNSSNIKDNDNKNILELIHWKRFQNQQQLKEEKSIMTVTLRIQRIRENLAL